MTAVYIILGILLFFFLLSLLRIGVRADFVGDLADTSVTVIAGPAQRLWQQVPWSAKGCPPACNTAWACRHNRRSTGWRAHPLR